MEFVYLVTTTDGYVVRVTTAGNPEDHPALWGRVANIETLGKKELEIVK